MPASRQNPIGRADLQYADKESFEEQAHEFERKQPNFTPGD